MPIRRAKHEAGEVTIGGPRIRRGPDPNTDLLYRGGDLGCNLAMEIIVEEPGRLGRVNTLDCRLDLVDLDIEGVAGRVDRNAGRQLQSCLVQSCRDIARNLNTVAGRLLVDIDQHRIASVGSNAYPLRSRRATDGSDVVDCDDAVGERLYDSMAERNDPI